ncbi:MAG: hemin uptake protein HemP [Rhodocyclaceae bacterium]
MKTSEDHISGRKAPLGPFNRAGVAELAQPKARRWVAKDILCGAPEAEIEHQGAVYRLRLTSQGKLILTK